ncbi:MAG TPA: hypothetical protein VHD76_09215 [Bryobacteraceae bacterium]|nr:hypothetical protein [Bryobacteraceae bacterium]
MDSKQKMGIAGAGLLVLGTGLSLLGAALLTPIFAGWAAAWAQKGTARLTASGERASQTIGTVAGTLHRSFREAARTGISEIRKING